MARSTSCCLPQKYDFYMLWASRQCWYSRNVKRDYSSSLMAPTRSTRTKPMLRLIKQLVTANGCEGGWQKHWKMQPRDMSKRAWQDAGCCSIPRERNQMLPIAIPWAFPHPISLQVTWCTNTLAKSCSLNSLFEKLKRKKKKQNSNPLTSLLKITLD